MLELRTDKIRARFTTLGARLVSLDFAGADVVMGGGTDADILAGDWTTGAVAGRIAGRITNSRINIDGVEYPLAELRRTPAAWRAGQFLGPPLECSVHGECHPLSASIRPMATRAIPAPST